MTDFEFHVLHFRALRRWLHVVHREVMWSCSASRVWL